MFFTETNEFGETDENATPTPAEESSSSSSGSLEDIIRQSQMEVMCTPEDDEEEIEGTVVTSDRQFLDKLRVVLSSIKGTY